MPAEIEFVLGRAGSGKSRKLRHDISNLAREGKRVLLIVNEQFTYENEKMLADKLGGLLTVSVLSFTTLARKVLRETGCDKTFISPQGRRMLIRKIAEENSGGLSVFQKTSRTPGFSEKCDELFTKCKRFSISPEDLANAAEQLPENAQLRKKLSDIALLYGKAKEYQEKEYLDSDDLYIELIKRLPGSFAAGSHIFVDNFDRPNKLIYSVMEKLMECAASLTVSLQLCVGGARDADLFEPNFRAYNKLRETARQLGCGIKETRLPDDSAPWGGDRHNSPALLHLEHELFAWPAEKFGGEQDSVTVFEAGDRVSEAEALASAVEKYIREGCRYREMAVIVPDTQVYASAIRREFIRRGIPFFMDAKRPLAGHPVTELMIAALRCANRSFRREDMLRLIKSGLCGLTPDESEILENFILKYCIRGKGFEEPFPQKEVPPEAESAREKIMHPLLELKQGLSAPAAGEKARALYAYLEKLGVYNALREKVTELKESGRLEPMEENAQVWNIVMELLSQVDKIMGDSELDQERFIAVLEEGLGAYEIGVIPTTVDQVLIGTMDRTRRGSVRILFAAGCVDGLLPPVRSDDGVIDDAELKKMGELGLTPWANTEETAEYDRLDLYTSLVKPSDRLWLSYTVNSGKESAPASAFIEKIRNIFSIDKLSGNIAGEGGEQKDVPYDASSALKLLSRQLREYADFKNKEAVSPGLFAYFLKTERFRPQTESILQALFYDPSSPPLGRQLSALLYGRTLEGSASRQ
jgi:ATP-dependent helicase/nuclease subunit B